METHDLYKHSTANKFEYIVSLLIDHGETRSLNKTNA